MTCTYRVVHGPSTVIDTSVHTISRMARQRVNNLLPVGFRETIEVPKTKNPGPTVGAVGLPRGLATRAERVTDVSIPQPSGFHASDLHIIDVERYIDRFQTMYDDSAGSGGCWQWTGYRNRAGYGLFQLAQNATVLAHRVAWVLWTGESLTDNLTVDHLCRNTSCVNPGHLERVPIRENIMRATKARRHSLHPEEPQVRAVVQHAATDGTRDKEGRLRKVCPVCRISYGGGYLSAHIRRAHLGGL